MAITLSDRNRFREGPNLFIPHRKPIGPVRLRLDLPGRVSDFWDLRGSTRNMVTGLDDGTHYPAAYSTDANGLFLDCDGTNAGAYDQVSSRSGRVYTPSDPFSLLAVVRIATFATALNCPVDTRTGYYRDASIGAPQGANVGRCFFSLDTTGTDVVVTTPNRDDTASNWDWGLLIGRSNSAGIISVRFKSLPFGTGIHDQTGVAGGAWSGTVGGEYVSVGVSGDRNNAGPIPSAHPVAWGGVFDWYIDDAEFMEIWRQGIGYFLEPA